MSELSGNLKRKNYEKNYFESLTVFEWPLIIYILAIINQLFIETIDEKFELPKVSIPVKNFRTSRERSSQ